MNFSAISRLPSAAWRPGWHFSASALTGKHDGNETGYRTLTELSEFAPDIPAPPWSFQTGITIRGDRAQVLHFANGVILHVKEGQQWDYAAIFSIAPGVVKLRTTFPCNPSIFSPEAELHTLDKQQWIEHAGGGLVLAVNRKEGATESTLVAGPGDHQSLLHAARSFETFNLDEFIDRAVNTLLEQSELLGLFDAPGLCSRELLLARLRKPEGRIAHYWHDSAEGVMDTRDLHTLIQAWLIIQPSIAEELLRSVLALQKDDGALPSLLSPHGNVQYHPARCPLIAHLCRQCAERTGNQDFLRYAAPRILKHLSWATAYFDRGRNGIHMWQSPEEAIFPDTFDDGLATCDLTSLLLAEIAEYQNIQTELGSASDENPFSGVADALQTNLRDFFWDEASGCYKDRYIGREHIERITASSIFPLWVSALTAVSRHACLEQISNSGRLGSKQGIRSWQEWDHDEEPASVDIPAQSLILSALIRSGENKAAGQLARSISNTLSGTDELASASTREGALQTPDETHKPSLLLFSRSIISTSLQQKNLSPLLKWMERRRIALTVIPVALLILSVIVITVTYMGRLHPPVETAQSIIGLAKRHFEEGNYEKSIALYEELSDQGVGVNFVPFLLGNAYYANSEFAHAEESYQKAIKESHDPKFIINLGLSVYKQGRLDEAEKIYTDFIDEYEQSNPALANRAKRFLSLVKQQ